MHQHLSSGEFFGSVRRRRTVGSLHLVETCYAPRTRLPRHVHEHAYICLVRRGHYREEYGGRQRVCGPLTVAFHPPEEVHCEEFARDETWSFNIELTTSWLARWRDFAARCDWTADFHGGALAALALRLHAEFLETDEASPLAIEGLTLEILAAAWRGTTAPPPRTPPRWLARVRDTLHEGFARPWTLGELAARAGVHPVHVAAAFRKHYGCSVGDYLRRRRVEFACRQLATSAAPLVEVALSAGFADQSHFSRIFKRLTGLTPTAYRQEATSP